MSSFGFISVNAGKILLKGIQIRPAADVVHRNGFDFILMALPQSAQTAFALIVHNFRNKRLVDQRRLRQSPPSITFASFGSEFMM